MPQDFDVQGFLGEQALDFREGIRKQYGSLFSFAEELNRVGQRLKSEISPRSDNATELFAAMLWIRIINSFASAQILASYGLCADARVVVRSMLEALFHLGSCDSDPKHADAYDLSQLAKQEERMRHISQSQVDELKYLKEHVTPAALDELKLRIKETGARVPIKPWRLSEKARLRWYYDVVYGLLSEDVHISPRALKRYLVNSGSGPELDWGPEVSGVPDLLLTAITIVRRAIDYMSSLFKLDPKMDDLDQEFRRIAPPVQGASDPNVE